jgi:PAS domain S-box-containing protein
MKPQSITTKLVLVLGAAFIVLNGIILVSATSRLKTIVNQSQNTLYEEKLQTILQVLESKYQRLLATQNVDAYEAYMKRDAVKTLRQAYYQHEEHQTYPFIIASDGTVIMHPRFHAGNRANGSSPYIKKMITHKDGYFDCIEKPNRKIWCIFRHFPRWNWIVGYTIPHSVKYADVQRFRTIFILIIASVTIAALAAVFYIVSSTTKPIRTLTTAADTIAKGDLDRRIDVETIADDEIGTLARSFETMQNSIKDTVESLAATNRQLRSEIEKRAQAEHRLRTIVQNMPVMMYACDREGLIVAWNAECENVTGYTAEEIVQNPHAPRWLVPDESYRRHIALQRTEKNNDFRNMEGDIWCKDGSRRTILWSDISAHFPIPEWDSWIVGIDITEMKRLEDELRQADKMKAIGQLAGGIAHDFNNQLTGILGYADLIRVTVKNDPSIGEYTKNIIAGIKRAADLTSKLLAFSRKGKYANEPVDIHGVIDEVTDILSHTIDKRIVVSCRLEATQSVVSGDSTQLQSALLNIALNARDAMGAGGELTITTATVSLDSEEIRSRSLEVEPGEYCTIAFIDTGIGMDTETLKRIFEPFYTTKQRGKGTGMGLSAVYGTVKNHSGDISVSSIPGEGAVFTIYLPVADTAEASALSDTQTLSADSLRPASILLVDDEDAICEVTSQALEKKGFTVMVAKNGAEAVAYYRDNWKKIDLVILDMVMPVMHGDKAFDEMKKINPDVVAILATGYSIEKDTNRALELGVKKCIQKPFRGASLIRTINEVLESSRA